MSAIAIKEMNNHEVLWQRYYKDFVYHYLYLSANPDDLEHKLLQITFSDLFNNYSEMKVIAAHCYIYLCQLDLGKIVALLKSLGTLQTHDKSQESLYQGDPESFLIATLWTSKHFTNSSISKFVIDSLFAVLIDTMYSNESDSRLSTLQKWFKNYRDTVSSYS